MSQPLIVVPPLEITPAMLTACDVPEADYPEYDAGTTYALGARVIVAAAHSVYESLAGSNTGNAPASSPAKWIRVGPTNRWRLFEHRTSSATVQAAQMSYEITPGRVVTAIAVLGVQAQTVTVTMTDPVDGVVYSHSAHLYGAIAAADWWSYFFSDLVPQTQVVRLDLPAYGTAAITVVLTSATGDVRCANLVLGQHRFIGIGPRSGSRVGITDYSRKEPDEFGEIDLIERAYSKRAEISTLVRRSEVDALQSLLARYRATPVLWVASPRLEALVLLGFYKTFDIAIEYARYADVVIDIEGMT